MCLAKIVVSSGKKEERKAKRVKVWEKKKDVYLQPSPSRTKHVHHHNQNFSSRRKSSKYSGSRPNNLVLVLVFVLESVTRNYFENLVRALENGLSDVNSTGASSKTTSSKCVAGSSKAKSGRGKGSFRIGGSSKGAEDSGSWACDHCTYLNPSRSATACQMCSQRR